jgi:hypothetical protein
MASCSPSARGRAARRRALHCCTAGCRPGSSPRTGHARRFRRIRVGDQLRSLFVEHAPAGCVRIVDSVRTLGVSRRALLQRVKRGEPQAIHMRNWSPAWTWSFDPWSTRLARSGSDTIMNRSSNRLPNVTASPYRRRQASSNRGAASWKPALSSTRKPGPGGRRWLTGVMWVIGLANHAPRTSHLRPKRAPNRMPTYALIPA